MTYQELWKELAPRYGADEARAVVRMVLSVGFGLTWADVLCGKVELLDDAQQQRLQTMQQRLLQGEPVQYALGVADFGERQFRVEHGVLIPRPETWQLCRWVADEWSNRHADLNASPCRVLDIGTGSGCVAITLALDLPMAEVTAWDLSPVALKVARRNALEWGARVHVEQQDALCPPDDGRQWEVIVSNPPYICHRERAQMEPHVVEHEPAEALFVPDEVPLLFYEAIGRYAKTALRKGGELFVEVNALYATQVAELFAEMGLLHATVRQDQFGHPRFVRAVAQG